MSGVWSGNEWPGNLHDGYYYRPHVLTPDCWCVESQNASRAKSSLALLPCRMITRFRMPPAADAAVRAHP